MRRDLLAALLLLPGLAAAQVSRVTLETPLAPVVGNPTNLPTPVALPTLPSALTPGLPLSASALVGPVRLPAAAAIPVKAAALPAPVAAMAAAKLPSFAATAAPALRQGANPARVIESLKLHGAKAVESVSVRGEAGVVAAEKGFLSAAALDEGGLTGGDALPSAEESAKRAALLEKLLQRVTLADAGKPEERAALTQVFERMLVSPTAQNFVQAFLDGGHTATVGFHDMPGSVLYEQDGRKYFSGTRALTGWNAEKKTVEVFLNRNYLHADQSLFRDDLPPILAHELLGHGLWYAVTAPLNLTQAYALHEQHEQQARALGWIVDYELDRNFADHGAWTYLSDPANYLASIRMQLPVYATMLSGEELSRPLEAYRGRMSLAKAGVEDAQRRLANYRSWYPVMDYFIEKRGVKAERFTLLRQEMAQYEEVLQARLSTAESVVAALQEMIGFLEGPQAGDYLAYLKEASAHPYIKALEQDAENLGAALQKVVRDFPPVQTSGAAAAAVERPQGQISWEEFMRMYEKDRAEDRKRPRWLRYWQD